MTLDKKILNIIQEEQQRATPKTDITKKLLTQGYTQQEIQDAFFFTSNESEPSSLTTSFPPLTKKKLTTFLITVLSAAAIILIVGIVLTMKLVTPLPEPIIEPSQEMTVEPLAPSTATPPPPSPSSPSPTLTQPAVFDSTRSTLQQRPCNETCLYESIQDCAPIKFQGSTMQFREVTITISEENESHCSLAYHIIQTTTPELDNTVLRCSIPKGQYTDDTLADYQEENLFTICEGTYVQKMQERKQ